MVERRSFGARCLPVGGAASSARPTLFALTCRRRGANAESASSGEGRAGKARSDSRCSAADVLLSLARVAVGTGDGFS